MASELPTDQQRLASDPGLSVWVGANAGSGKTRVLTQRVARLLLAGAEPAKILCLTYTKAAAAEMQTRLFALLGDWSMQDDASLTRMLGALTGGTEPIGPALLARARRLFARALETPGGLKIQTIHAFCDSLLRRFPLEGGVSPSFDVIDDRQAALMLADIRDDMARASEAGVDPAFDLLAMRLNEDALTGLVREILSRRTAFGHTDPGEVIAAAFGEAASQSPQEIARHYLIPALGRIRAVAGALNGGISSDQKLAARLGGLDQLVEERPLVAADALANALLVGSGAREGQVVLKIPTKKLGEAHPGLRGEVEVLAELAITLRSDLNAQAAAARTGDLYRFAQALLVRYEAAKSARSLLDFDDLISRTRDLLQGSELRAWVLYKLDQGIDHVLVDEAQDTAPRQWDVIAAITDDFHVGGGRRSDAQGPARSVFVVGDEKQSIYSFQGAEPTAFGEMRARLGERLSGIGDRLERPDLITSFRSAPAILDYVDAVFEGSSAEGVTFTGDPIRHLAHRGGDAGWIDLWPLVERRPGDERPPWWEPLDLPPPDDPRLRLADALAHEIKRMLAEDHLPPRVDRAGRRVRAGDILVLVRKRDRLSRSLIETLKSLNVPVAGSDRLSLAEELAVKDVIALLRAVLTPADDLSLAAALRSPLCSVDETGLFDLAHGRQGSLWQVVMDSGDALSRDREMLADLASRSGYLAPFEFLERILTRHDGRRRLLARLGPEAEDCIDELLAQALIYEARETPSLAGFVAWIEAGDVTLKREMDKGADQVRVMTIHGAKGLEAPVVILPDTVGGRHGGGGRPLVLPTRPGDDASLAVWAGPKKTDDPVTANARAIAEAREQAEARRLLYVGLTRAEDWLILCGAGMHSAADQGWYGLLEGAIRRQGGIETPPPEGLEGQALTLRPSVASDASAASVIPPGEDAGQAGSTPPEWVRPAPREPRARRLAPSSLGPHVRIGATVGGLDPKRARSRGEAVHLLLERLPGLAPDDVPAMASRLLAAMTPRLDPDLVSGAVDEALAVLSDPALGAVFGPATLGEVAVSIPVPGLEVLPMQGRIDRLVIGTDEVTVVDFKTDAHVPDGPADTPGAYLAQLGAYVGALATVYPGHRVGGAILWTRTRTLMRLDNEALSRAFADAIAAQRGIDLGRGGS